MRTVPSSPPPDLSRQAIDAAFAALTERERTVREELERAERDMEELNRIGVALSAQHDLVTLLQMIVEKARAITGADAGSLYLVDETPEGRQQLIFKVTQNDSCDFPFREFAMPLSESSISGYVALHGELVQAADAYELIEPQPETRPYQFNPAYDQQTGYRTRSMLTLPMKNAKGNVLGVLQLINCKRDRTAPLPLSDTEMANVQPFPERAIRLALSLASQAAVAYENSRLYQNIEALFEGFVQASVTAIEQRDPTTSGHSTRVATMTVRLAEAVNRETSGPYAGVQFNPEQMKEIRYASLLHDFGKVAVPEEILVKAKKLYPSQITGLQQRFDYVRKALEMDHTQKKFEAVLARGRDAVRDELARLEGEYSRRQAELDEYFRFILEVNEPTVLPAGKFDRLIDIANKIYLDPRGEEHNLLTSEEVHSLSIPQGSLDDDERRQIELHVEHSFNFLMRIPWTREMKDIPSIARAHHEKLNGSGYPHGLRGDEIPPQAKMMTICDIFDALSAVDRPYKKAVPIDRALDILEMSVRDRELDSHLLRMFVEARIFQLTSNNLCIA